MSQRNTESPTWKKWLHDLGAIAGIIGLIIAIVANLRIGKEKTLYDPCDSLQPELSINSHQKIDTVSSNKVSIEGVLSLKEKFNKTPNAITVLGKEKLHIEILVKPKAENIWYVQSKPTLKANGFFESLINLGDEKFGSNQEYYVATLITDKDFSQGQKVPELPVNGCASQIKLFRTE